MKKLVAWLINRFDYIKIYLFICALFFFSIFPMGYYWTTTNLEHIQSIDYQLNALNEEKVYKDLYSLVQEHRFLMRRYILSGHQDDTGMKELENEIHVRLEKANRLGSLKSNLIGENGLVWQKQALQDIQKKWNDIIYQLPTLSKRESNSIHKVILQELNIQMNSLVNGGALSYERDAEKYALLQDIFLLLSSLQDLLDEFILTSEDILLSSTEHRNNYQTNFLIHYIESDLQSLQLTAETRSSMETSGLHLQMIDLLGVYQNSIYQLISDVKKQILDVKKAEMTASEFKAIVQKVVNLGNELWENGLDQLLEVYTAEKSRIYLRLWVILGTTIILVICACFLGLTLTFNGIGRLEQLTQITDEFAKGNLAIRVTDPYHDDIGRLARAFNRMAERLEEIIRHLYELLDATTALSNGDLTARIQIQEGSEFIKVALSFNKMAETFQTIINRLQKTGKTLTSSAQNIASAAKEQEINVVAQAATTREIAISSHDISLRAQQFAQTMNEINQTVEQSSQFALKGKEALIEMEGIMRNMVEAATHIASTLAILKEKAHNISGITVTISKVADQTNLLSLNASIEAEKAGEFGKGFAVIAREIRRLADQTALSTLDVESMISDITTAVSSSVFEVNAFTQEIRIGVKQAHQVGEQIVAIIEQVQNFTARFELVNQGMQAQSAGAEQINKAIVQLSQTAKQTSDAIHQFQNTVQELNLAANDLNIKYLG